MTEIPVPVRASYFAAGAGVAAGTAGAASVAAPSFFSMLYRPLATCPPGLPSFTERIVRLFDGRQVN